MFRNKEIELYHSITAPESLKQRVVNTSKKPVPRPWYARRSALLTTFASLAILISTVCLLTLSSPTTAIFVEGNKIGSEPIELSFRSPYAKANKLYMEDNSFSTMLEIDVSGDTTINVSSGTIYDTENSAYACDSIHVTKDTSLCWTVDTQTDLSPCIMTVTTDDTAYTYILEKNKQTEIWTISQQ